MRVRILSTVLAAAFAATSLPAAASDCVNTRAEALLDYRAATPLLPMTAENTRRVTVFEDGCVLVREPAYSKLAGLHGFALDAAEHRALLEDIVATAVSRFDEKQVRSRVAEATKRRSTSTGFLHFVADEDLIEVSLSPKLSAVPGNGVHRIRWRSLETDLLNNPEDPDLRALASLRSLVLALASLPQDEERSR